jgi:hypothetical protein
MLPWRQFRVLARLTTLEATRQPICLLLLTTCVVAITLLPLVITHTLEEGDKLVRDSALAIHLVVGLLIGSYAACSSLVREIHRGTAASVLSKPVGREVFFGAKFAGIAVFLLLFSAAASIATVVGTRAAETAEETYAADWWALAPLLAAPLVAYAGGAVVNYRWRRPFNSSAFALLLAGLAAAGVFVGFFDAQGQVVPFASTLPLRVFPASVLVTMAIIVLAALAVSLAPRLDTVPTISLCSVLLMLGLISDYLFGRAAAAGQPFATAAYYLLPNWQHFWVVDAFSGGGSIAPAYLAQAAVYAVLYSTGILALGAFVFRRIELR